MRGQERDLTLEALRVHQVVGIHPRQIHAVREAGDLVQPRGQAAMASIAHEAYARIVEMSYDIERAIGGAVVDEQ